jgi:hypothetical protein
MGPGVQAEHSFIPPLELAFHPSTAAGVTFLCCKAAASMMAVGGMEQPVLPTGLARPPDRCVQCMDATLRSGVCVTESVRGFNLKAVSPPHHSRRALLLFRPPAYNPVDLSSSFVPSWSPTDREEEIICFCFFCWAYFLGYFTQRNYHWARDGPPNL